MTPNTNTSTIRMIPVVCVSLLATMMISDSISISFLAPPSLLVSAMVPPSSPSESLNLKLRICQGSSCLGRCRGAFNPLASFENLRLVEGGGGSDADSSGGSSDCSSSSSKNINNINNGSTIQLEESFCMNQCKRGPNVRIIDADTGNLLTVDGGAMNQVESNRGAFQGVSSEDRVNHLWGIAKKVADGTMTATEKGSADKLRDIMPRAQS